MTFRYCSDQGIWSQRQVEPARLVLKHYRWYLYAWCRERQDFRYFKLSRMQNLQVLTQGFDSDYSHLDLPQTMSESDLTPVSLRMEKTRRAINGIVATHEHIKCKEKKIE